MSSSPSAIVPHGVAPRHAFPALVILVLQVALYLWMAPRGFEFTDESYYLHNFLHWREFTGTVTFFGAYFEWPFRAMGASIAGIRILSMLLILASAGILMHEVLRFSESGPVPGGHHPAWYTVAPMASAMLYFGYLSTLRAPSYNLLCLCAMAIATACMLRSIKQQRAGRAAPGAAFLYGLALGACFLSKATTALIMGLAHLVFFVAVNRSWDWKWLARLLLLVGVGFAVNLAALTLSFPEWPASLREGMEITRARGGYGIGGLIKGLSWDMQRVLVLVGPWLLAAGVAYLLARRKLETASRTMVSVLAVLLAGAITLAVVLEHQNRIWLFVMVASTLGLWTFERRSRRGQPAQLHARDDIALMALLFFLPVGFSFGTNMSVLAHSALASMFAFCAVYLRLYRLARLGALAGRALAICLLLLCVPALVTQWLALTDVRYTYRQTSALGAQDSPVPVAAGASVVRVDQATERALRDILAMAESAGLQPGQDVFDLTGDGPGVILATGANPLGSPWLLGGAPGSAAAVERVMQKLDKSVLRRAWLLTSTNNPLRIQNWENMLARQIGPGTHRLAGSVDIFNRHHTWMASSLQTINVQLWKPVSGPAREAGPVALSAR